MCLILNVGKVIMIVLLHFGTIRMYQEKVVEYEVLGAVRFFFQAEDGIRDSSVTGVQTCALPICERAKILIALDARVKLAFLREFYARIQGDQDFRALTATEAIAAAGSLPTTAGILDRKSVV